MIIKNILDEDVGVFIGTHNRYTKHIESDDPYIIGSHRAAFNILNNNYEVKLDNLPHRVKHYKNITLFSNSTDNAIKIDGNVAILDVYPAYSHFLIDVVGKFLYLQKFYPNLKPLFVNTFKDDDIKKHIVKVIKEIIEKLSPHCNILGNINLYNNQDSYIFDNVITFNGRSDIESQMLFWNAGEIYPKLREIFLPKRKSFANRNIFISRATGSSRYNEIIPQLENEFKKRNYEIIYFEHMSFEQQIEAVYDAKNIVGILGGGLSNLIFANLDANVMTMCYGYGYYNDEWRHITENLGINHIDFQLADEKVETYFKLFDQIDTLFP